MYLRISGLCHIISNNLDFSFKATYQCYLAAYNKPYLEENLPNQRIITAQVGQIILDKQAPCRLNNTPILSIHDQDILKQTIISQI